jgi:hypothetical protein
MGGTLDISKITISYEIFFSVYCFDQLNKRLKKRAINK